MEYESYFYGRNLVSEAGCGSNVWMMKMPISCAPGSNGGAFIGSLVEYHDAWYLGTNYPEPRLAGINDQCMLQVMRRLQEKHGEVPPGCSNRLAGIAGDIVTVSQFAAASFSLKNDLSFSAGITGNVPGIPVNLSLKFAMKNIDDMSISFKDARMEYVRSKVLAALAESYGWSLEEMGRYNADLIGNMSGCRMIDRVLKASKYAITYTCSCDVSGSINVGATAGDVTIGINATVTSVSGKTFTVNIDSQHDYLLGIQAIDWEDVDFD